MVPQEIAGRGSEGLYAALVSAPLFAVKLLAGAMSGWLLHRYVPATGERHPQTMWAIIGLISIASPILMLIFRRCIEDPDIAVEASTEMVSGGYEMVELEQTTEDAAVVARMTKRALIAEEKLEF